MKKKSMISSLFLFLAACIWGFAFVAQSVGMDYMGPLTFNGVRFLIGGTVLLPLIYVRMRKLVRENRGSGAEPTGDGSKKGAGIALSLKGGICCGLAICAASVFQQLGIQYTTVGKAGFITTLYIILVPLFGLFMHRKIPGKVWIAAAAAAVGLYLLCITEGFAVGKGDLLVFVCAILFSVHILVIDYFSPKVDGVVLSCIQFYTAGILCGAGALLMEHPSWGQLVQGMVPILYAGIMSCGVAYTLQVVGQKELEPTVASLILSMESVVSVLAGWLLLGQSLTVRELAGCVLVFAAVILVQIQPGDSP
jgi:Permeases of the drug/metabolite transporter (DMT) superfamily